MQSRPHLNHVETMRALAALMVAVFHFTNHYNGQYFIIDSQNIREPFQFGAQGVEMFYLISGFIIPYSLSTAGYKIYDYFRYLAKRIIRLFPPYLITIGLIMCVNFILNKVLWGSTFYPDVQQIIINVFFIADLFPDVDWINPIFATLKVELQFYFVIGLLFPLIIKNRIYFLLITAAMLLGAYLVYGTDNILSNSPYFFTGVAAYLITKDGYKWEYLLSIGIIFGLLIDWYMWQDVFINLLGLILILFLPKQWKVLNLTGKISYSFYLTHGLCGGWFMYYISWEWLGLNYPVIAIILAILVSWAGAFILYTLIERPSLKFAKKIKYKN